MNPNDDDENAENLTRQQIAQLVAQQLATAAAGGAGGPTTVDRMQRGDNESGAVALHAMSNAADALLRRLQAQFPPHFVFHPSDVVFDMASELGHGSSGTVRSARIKSRNRTCAAKFFEPHRFSRGLREANNCVKLHHDNVGEVYGVTVVTADDPPRLAILLARGKFDFKRFFNEFPKHELTSVTIRRFAAHIASGLAYLHSGLTFAANREVALASTAKPVVHCDLKPQNILVFTDENILKIVDFGGAIETAGPGSSIEHANVMFTPEYAPPEISLQHHHGITRVWVAPPVDVFAFGVILLQMIVSKSSYERYFFNETTGKNELDASCLKFAIESTKKAVCRGELSCTGEEEEMCVAKCLVAPESEEVARNGQDLIDLCVKCLMVNPKHRPQNGSAILQLLTRNTTATITTTTTRPIPVPRVNNNDDDDTNISDHIAMSNSAAGPTSTLSIQGGSASDVGDVVAILQRETAAIVSASASSSISIQDLDAAMAKIARLQAEIFRLRHANVLPSSNPATRPSDVFVPQAPIRCFRTVQVAGFEDALRRLLSLTAVPPGRPDLDDYAPEARDFDGVLGYVNSNMNFLKEKPEIQRLIQNCGLTDDDIKIIFAFKIEHPYAVYKWLNGHLIAQRDVEHVKHAAGPFFVLFYRAIEKLPKIRSRASRAILVRNIPALQATFNNYLVECRTGNTMNLWGVSSFSRDDRIGANQFAGGPDEEAIIYSCSELEGVDLDPFKPPLMQAENEILPLCPTIFKIQNVTKVGHKLVMSVEQRAHAEFSYVESLTH